MLCSSDTSLGDVIQYAHQYVCVGVVYGVCCWCTLLVYGVCCMLYVEFICCIYICARACVCVCVCVCVCICIYIYVVACDVCVLYGMCVLQAASPDAIPLSRLIWMKPVMSLY